MVAQRLCTNRANKNSNIKTFVTIISISRHIENPDIARTVYSGIFRHIEERLAIFSYVQASLETLKHIQAYSGITKVYGAIIRHIRNSAQPMHIQPCHIQNPGSFRIRGIFKSLLNMSDDQAYSKPWHS